MSGQPGVSTEDILGGRLQEVKEGSSEAHPSFGQSALPLLYSCEVTFSLLHTFVWWLFPESENSQVTSA